MNYDLSTPSGALKFAIDAHEGQVDKQGIPYFYHPARVGSALWAFGPDYVIAGFLHDVVEDTDYTLEDLASFGANPVVLSAVESVTKTESESTLEAYEASIRRAMADPVGRYVKAADVVDNYSRIYGVKPAKLRNRLREKYLMAQLVIAEFIPGYWSGWSVTAPQEAP